MPPNTPFFEQVKALVPWKLSRVQICRTPMQRRLLVDLIQEGAKHRGVALWYNDGSVELEAEAISTILAASAGKLSRPVRAAVFFYGVAPDSSMNPEENKQPQDGKPQVNTTADTEEQDMLRPHEPGYRDITFPRWLLQVGVLLPLRWRGISPLLAPLSRPCRPQGTYDAKCADGSNHLDNHGGRRSLLHVASTTGWAWTSSS